VKALFFFLLSIRFLVDGPFAFSIGNQKASGIISITLILLAVLSILRKIFLFVSVSLISAILASYHFGQSPIEEAVRFSSVVAVFVIFYSLEKPMKENLLLVFLWIVCTSNTCFQLFQQGSGSGLFVNEVWRFSGFFAHPNTAAIVYGISIVMTSNSLLSKRAKQPLTSITFLVICLIGLALTLSVGGILTALVCLAVLLVRYSPRRVWSFWLLASAFISGSASIAFPGLVTRFASLANSSTYISGDQTNSLVWRITHWQQFLPYFFDNPLFGIGFGSTTSGLLTADGLWPHNEYIRFMVECGSVGVILFSILAYLLLKRVRISALQVQNWAAPVTFSCLVGQLVNAITENTFTYTLPMVLLAVLIATSLKTQDLNRVIAGQNLVEPSLSKVARQQ